MFEPIEKGQTDIFRLTIRIAYLLIAIFVDAGFLYVALFPGSTRDERSLRFLTGFLLLIASLILSAPVLPYVVWRWIKHERPVFWVIALLIAAIPILAFAGPIILSF